ncbi:hypothetical protein FQ377_02450 [Arthrobacter echini]|uniref:Uncharacterized protein n=1 Tax=Arthrobacter echini TaxID=1529066 RepID=A0A5D0XUG9_9MICC|nr:hypothetical protein [Arthrobacter echini]TYD00336.1 hypothetical protein FQ377_02450 [Arthrobacter echini]
MQTTPVVKVTAAWLLCLLLLIAAFVAVVSSLNARLYSPEHRVDLYLGALQQGEGGRALGLLNATVPDGSDASLLDGDALRAATAPLEDTTIQDARDTGPDTVEVPVTYRVNDEDHTTLLPLEQTGTEWGVFEVWEFEPGVLPTVGVSTRHGEEASVNGVDVGLPDGNVELASFYPAAVSARYDTPYLVSSEERAVVAGTGSPAPLELVPEQTPELARAVDDQVHAFLDTCADQAVFQPTGCPFTYVTTEPLAGDIAWTIEEYPPVTVTEEGDDWTVSSLKGSARLETTLKTYFSGAETDVSESIGFEFEADLAVTGDEVTVTPEVPR